MEIASDLMASLRNRLEPARNASVAAGIDWAGLHARLVAGHAARRELGADAGPVLLSGSFMDWSRVAEQSGDDASCGINLMSSADGKIPAGIAGVSAGQPVAGGRG